MSIRLKYTVRCDRCGRTHDGSYYTETGALKAVRMRGWRHSLASEDGCVDCCQYCLKKIDVEAQQSLVVDEK